MLRGSQQGKVRTRRTGEVAWIDRMETLCGLVVLACLCVWMHAAASARRPVSLLQMRHELQLLDQQATWNGRSWNWRGRREPYDDLLYGPETVCPEYNNIYVESLPAPPLFAAPWNNARVYPRHWIDRVHHLGDPFDEGVEVEVRERRPDSCAPNVSYAHTPVGQAQSRIRDSHCNFINLTVVFGGYHTTYAISGDARRTPPLVKPDIEDDVT